MALSSCTSRASCTRVLDDQADTRTQPCHTPGGAEPSAVTSGAERFLPFRSHMLDTQVEVSRLRARVEELERDNEQLRQQLSDEPFHQLVDAVTDYAIFR